MTDAALRMVLVWVKNPQTLSCASPTPPPAASGNASAISGMNAIAITANIRTVVTRGFFVWAIALLREGRAISRFPCQRFKEKCGRDTTTKGPTATAAVGLTLVTAGRVRTSPRPVGRFGRRVGALPGKGIQKTK